MGGMLEYYSTVLNNRVSAKAALAEFIGTAIFVLTGTAAVVGLHWSHTVGMEHEYGLLIVATAFGIALMTMLYSTQHTSGGQLNPAVSLALVGSGYLPLWQAIVNIAAQLLGAVVGSLLLTTVLPPHAESNLGLNFLPRHDSTRLVMQAMFAEALGSFILTFVILETLKNPKSKSVSQFPVATGLTFFLIILVFGPISSGSFNPARSFGPALVKFNFRYLWVFFLGPILGALLAVPAHFLIVADWDTMAELHETHTSMYTQNIEDPNAPLIPTSRREPGGNVD